MCGRFTMTLDLEEIKRFFRIAEASQDYPPSYNTAPGREIPVILTEDVRRLSLSRWGLVPSWAKDQSIGNKLINARAETLLEKPSFRKAFKYRRCIIPADSFFEWDKKGKVKQPYRILRQDNQPLALAGLWEIWTSPSGNLLHSCTIITVPANSLLEPIHDRMPAILSQEETDLWLDPLLQNPLDLISLLKPYPDGELHMYPVSNLVNSPQNNTPQVIAPLPA